ncbi:uncharacterized protein LOC127602295 isoform X6 [Hippocampus zosterae]|uniref:uncharacterized protein LOC127602295 isoform X5 n=1 Tax=Hippocampus zosterae TaxID=109293 RepID=UPI00223D13F1|nr:uncharacterized protein LOC127602295 isoform X5 [Hippocampus zosterae]XP_051924332.1 uncharacterized protein LOC127602295 isoform X6 [Hippocampus zosterae]
MAWNSLRCSRHFSRSCLAQNTMSAVPLPGRKPAWDSGRTRSARQFPRHHLLGPALKDEGVEAGLRRSPGESAAPSSSVAQGAAGQDRGSRLLRMSDGSGAP